MGDGANRTRTGALVAYVRTPNHSRWLRILVDGRSVWSVLGRSQHNQVNGIVEEQDAEFPRIGGVFHHDL